ncbi:MAG: site-specific integrase [Actinomycetota bacterium]|nr:site-specific integrase [Actinomycetota bacterium]
MSELRPQTQASYRNSVDTHLRPRWGHKRLDAITVDDAAKLVRELRAEGKAEWTIATVLRAASRVFTFARRRLNWHGVNPISRLENGERPKVTQTQRRRIFKGDELAQTLAVAHEPYRTLFAFAATTGARLSECLGLVWADLDVADPDDATVTFAFQADRKSNRVTLKTDEARRTVELPRSLVSLLLTHRARSAHSQAGVHLRHALRPGARTAQYPARASPRDEGRDRRRRPANVPRPPRGG